MTNNIIVILIISIIVALFVMIGVAASFAAPVERIQSQVEKLNLSDLQALENLNFSDVDAIQNKLSNIDFDKLLAELNDIDARISSLANIDSYISKLSTVQNFCTDRQKCVDVDLGFTKRTVCSTFNPCNL